MIKLIKIQVLALFLFLFSGHVLSVSIVYNGFECQSVANIDNPTPSGERAQSKFEVIEEVGGGIYRLRLTGGLPRFVANNRDVCIDGDTAIGFTGIPNIDGIPRRLDAIDATAYFNGQDLIISVNSINTDLSARRGTFSSFTTSHVSPYSNTLIFDYDVQAKLFKLKKTIQNKGLVHTSGSTGALTPFFETILPTSFGNAAQDKPRILSPVANIEYMLE